VSSGEGGGVRIGGGGAYQKQFNHHMYLPMEAQEMQTDPAAPQDGPVLVDIANPEPPAPAPDVPPAPAENPPPAADIVPVGDVIPAPGAPVDLPA